MKLLILTSLVAGCLCGCANFAVKGGITSPWGDVSISRDGKRTVVGIDLDGKSIVRSLNQP